MSIKGRQFTGKLSRVLDSIREQFLWVTVGKTGSGRVSLDVVGRKFYRVSTGNVVAVGSDDRTLVKTAHGLLEGDLIRISTTSNGILEKEVLVDQVVDANTVILAAVLSASLAAGDTFEIYRPTFERVAADGSSLATVVSPPLQIGVEGVATAVNDSATPANVVAVPVKIMSATGSNINITAGDLNVQLSHAGASYDSTRIGDGTNLLGVNANNEAKVHDTDALTKLTQLLTELQLKADLTETQPVSLASQPLPTGAATEATLATRATEATLSTLNGKVPSNLTVTATRLLVDGSGVTQPVSAASLPLPTGASTAANQTTANTSLATIATQTTTTATNTGTTATGIGAPADAEAGSDTGTFSIIALIKRGLQGITTIISVLPTARGQQTKANSSSVTIASDQGALSVTQSALAASSSDVTVNNTAGTVTAPAGARWAKVYASKNNTDDVVVRLGGTATATVGTILEPARSEDFFVAGDFSHISVSGTQKIHITWGA